MKKLLGRVGLVAMVFAFSGVAWGACVTQLINYGSTVNGTLAADDCIDHNGNGKDYYYDYYEFTGTAGQQILITNVSTAIDADLLLVLPDNTTTVYNDDGAAGSTNARIPVNSGFYTLTQSGKFHIVTSSAVSLQTGAYGLTLTLNNPTPSPTTRATVEFYNVYLKHYFVTAEQAEATAIDNGSAGAGWVRTGFSYDVYGSPVASLATDGKVATATSAVCRFYGTPGVGPNSHFYTADAAECEQVKKDPGWFYEGIAYHIQQPVNGACPTGTQPIYRAYNDRAQFNDSNHRFITNAATYQQMSDKTWALEGIVMCTTALRSPTPVTGGSFKDPGGSGAGVTVAPGQLPGYVNATQPQTTPTRNLPPGMTNPGVGETNVTAGSSTGGFDFNLTGDGGFSTTTAGAVTISVPFNTGGIAAADLANPAKTMVRVHDREDGTQIDLAGDITTNGSTGMVTVDARGLPSSFVASVVHNASMEALGSDDVVPGEELVTLVKSASATSWPGQAWCLVWNPREPSLIAAVNTALGIAGPPTLNDIKRVLKSKVMNNAVLAQTIYQNDNLGPPNMVTANRICTRAPLRYYAHLTVARNEFAPDDFSVTTNEGTGVWYGRLYIGVNYLNSSVNSQVGSMLGVIAHEMLHSVQNGYRILGLTPKSYREGGATIYGKSIDNNQVITARSAVLNDIPLLNLELLGPEKARNRYGSQDFWAYIGRAYNGGKLNYLAGLYAAMRGTLGPDQNNPPASTMYGILDSYLKTTFSKPLADLYLEFLRERALTHNAASQMNHPNEVTVGFAEALFGTSVARRTLDVGNCTASKASVTASNIGSFALPAIVITPTGSLPPGNTTGVTLTVKLTPASSSIGALWGGWTYRANIAAPIAESNKFAGFGKVADEQVIVLLANLNPAGRGSFTAEITCGGVKIDSISPVKGAVGTVVTINGSGFGAQNDPRSVTVNGLAMTGVTWVSDTVLRATVPANASSGDVIVTVNGEKSNGVPFEVVAQCSAQQTAGGDTPDIRTIELGKTAGTFNFSYETYAQEDRIIVRYPNATGAVLHDSTCVGTNGTRTVPLTYSGNQSTISVQVIPNCRTGTGTSWNYTVSCP